MRTSRSLSVARFFAVAVLLAALTRAAAPATPPFRIGLNGVFIGNNTRTTDQQLAEFKELGVAGLRHLEPNDVGWSVVQQTNGLFTFTAPDGVLANSTYRFGCLPTFYGSGTLNYYMPPGTAATTAWNAVAYGTQTTTYLQTVVNRYKGAVQFWEIANEMNTKTTAPAGFSAAEYAAFLVFNRNAIRAADSSAQVVIGGELGNYGYPFENAYQWLRDVLAAGGGAGFDVFNYHDYKSWWTLPTHYDQFRAILDANGLSATPIWVTETAQASVLSNANINPAYASVDGQAADVWRRLCLLFAKGAPTVFWHSYWDNGNDTSGFRNMGLANSATGARKKSWHAFKLLNQTIEGFATATLVASGVTNDDNVTGGSGAWVVRFDFADGKRRWVAWSPDNQSYNLTGLTNVASVNLTTVVPATIASDGTAVTWATSTRAVTNGTLALTLADAPVLIEVASTTTSPPTAYLSNLSVRTTLASSQIVTVGLVVSGGSKSILLRAAGPALTSLGVTGAMTDPRLELYQGATKIAENNDWPSSLSATFTSLGAFAFPAASRDAALLQTLGGAYTVQATGTASGTVLIEGYDAGTGSGVRLVNLSARNRVGTGGDLLIAGFNVAGTGTLRVLIRGIGPTLATFGVTGPLADPKLELFDAAAAKIDENDNWSASLAATFAAVGAFPLPANSKDAALLATLTAGRSYTVQVSGVGGATGEGLVEIYEVP